MLRLALLFFALAVGAGVLGFGGWAGAFTSLAVLAFYLFAALLVFSLLASLVGAGHWTSGSSILSLLAAAIIGAGVYAWVQHGMSARALGASLDRGAAQVTADASTAIDTAASKTKRLISETGDSAKRVADGRRDDRGH